ncbi:unnamed protein product [Mucor fragilis]
MIYQEELEKIALACKGFPSNNISLSQRVFADLVLAKKWRNVKFKPNQGLQTCLFIAHEPEKTDKELVIIPVLQDEAKLSINTITNMFNSIDIPADCLTLAIYSSDSTIVYYHISKGLVKSSQRN